MPVEDGPGRTRRARIVFARRAEVKDWAPQFPFTQVAANRQAGSPTVGAGSVIVQVISAAEVEADRFPRAEVVSFGRSLSILDDGTFVDCVEA